MSKPKAPQGAALRYVGGEVFNVPARDLSEADLEQLAADPWIRRRLAAGPKSLVDALVASGVYVAADEAAAREQPSSKE